MSIMFVSTIETYPYMQRKGHKVKAVDYLAHRVNQLRLTQQLRKWVYVTQMSREATTSID